MGNPPLAASKSGAHRVHFQQQRPNCSQGDNKNRQAFVLTKLLFNGSFQASPVEVSTRLPLNHPSAQSGRAKELGRAGPLLRLGGLATREAASFVCCLMERGEDVRQAGLTHRSVISAFKVSGALSLHTARGH